MDFTNQSISKTYNNVMTNDGFVSDERITPNTINYNNSAISSQWISVFDGNGIKGNIQLSIEPPLSATSNIYPYLRYSINNDESQFFYLPGNSVNGLYALKYATKDDGYTLSASKLLFANNYAQFKYTKYPYDKIPENAVLTISGISNTENVVLYDDNLKNNISNKRESISYINKLSVNSANTNNRKMTPGSDLIPIITQTVNTSQFNTTNARTIWIKMSSWVDGIRYHDGSSAPFDPDLQPNTDLGRALASMARGLTTLLKYNGHYLLLCKSNVSYPQTICAFAAKYANVTIESSRKWDRTICFVGWDYGNFYQTYSNMIGVAAIEYFKY